MAKVRFSSDLHSSNLARPSAFVKELLLSGNIKDLDFLFSNHVSYEVKVNFEVLCL